MHLGADEQCASCFRQEVLSSLNQTLGYRMMLLL